MRRTVCQTGAMRALVIIGAAEPLGAVALAVLGRHRRDLMLDGLVDDGSDPHRLAGTVLEFTPRLLGIIDDYAVGKFFDERADLSIDLGLVDWELPDLDVVTGDRAVTEVAAMPADIVVVALGGKLGRAAARAALASGERLVLIASGTVGDDEQLVAALAGRRLIEVGPQDDQVERQFAPVV